MNIIELKHKLKELAIPEDSYCLTGGLPNEAYCIYNSNNIWEVYYSERGLKTNRKIFTDEASACKYFLYLLRIERK